MFQFLEDIIKLMEAEKSRKIIEAETKDEDEQQRRLTAMVLVSIMNRIHDEAKRKRIRKHEDEEEEYLVRKQQKQKQRKQSVQKRIDPTVEVASSGLEPDMPEAFKNVIEGLEGTKMKFVCEKIIETTDLNEHHNRLSMSAKKVKNKFLSEAEEEELRLLQSNREGMDVILIEPCRNVSQVQLGKWQIGGSMSYIFKKQWKHVVEKNKDSLKRKAVVQIWSFRAGPDARLGFALIKVRDGEDEKPVPK